METANDFQLSAVKSPPANCAVVSASLPRHCSSVSGVREKPITRVGSGRRFLRYRLKSAGISLRLVRSPEAPKITIVCMVKISSIKLAAGGHPRHVVDAGHQGQSYVGLITPLKPRG